MSSATLEHPGAAEAGNAWPLPRMIEVARPFAQHRQCAL